MEVSTNKASVKQSLLDLRIATSIEGREDYMDNELETGITSEGSFEDDFYNEDNRDKDDDDNDDKSHAHHKSGILHCYSPQKTRRKHLN